MKGWETVKGSKWKKRQRKETIEEYLIRKYGITGTSEETKEQKETMEE